MCYSQRGALTLLKAQRRVLVLWVDEQRLVIGTCKNMQKHQLVKILAADSTLCCMHAPKCVSCSCWGFAGQGTFAEVPGSGAGSTCDCMYRRFHDVFKLEHGQ